MADAERGDVLAACLVGAAVLVGAFVAGSRLAPASRALPASPSSRGGGGDRQRFSIGRVISPGVLMSLDGVRDVVATGSTGRNTLLGRAGTNEPQWGADGKVLTRWRLTQAYLQRSGNYDPIAGQWRVLQGPKGP